MSFYFLYRLGYVVLDSPYYSFLLINIILSHIHATLSNIILPLLLAAWGLLPNKNSYHIAGPARGPDPLHSVIEAQLDPCALFPPAGRMHQGSNNAQLFIWDYS